MPMSGEQQKKSGVRTTRIFSFPKLQGRRLAHFFLSVIIMKISTRHELEERACHYGVLPFFRNHIKGFSVEEMTLPGLLFGGNEFDGCWEWKGPVVRGRSLAYGKFFRRKAGFVNLDLLPHFLNFRRNMFPVKPDSTDEMILEIVELNDRMSSTDLRQSLNGSPRRRTAFDLPSLEADFSRSKASLEGRLKRHQLESPLQRLQMGGWLCISDFRYKQTGRGERYGWGVAEYSTPESLFERDSLLTDLSPSESLEYILDYVSRRLPGVSRLNLLKLLS